MRMEEELMVAKLKITLFVAKALSANYTML